MPYNYIITVFFFFLIGPTLIGVGTVPSDGYGRTFDGHVTGTAHLSTVPSSHASSGPTGMGWGRVRPSYGIRV
jgi:hypothetical protein